MLSLFSLSFCSFFLSFFSVCFFFFFQAEDGIRDHCVTGVQTCALPISRGASLLTMTVATLVVGYTVRGGGPFVMQTVPSTDAALLLYIGVLAVTGLSLGPATARHERAERALREANEHLAAVIQSSPLAIYTLDPASTVRSWNRAAEALYGWRAEEVIGRPLPTIAQNMEELRGEALRGREASRRRQDRTAVNISLSVAPLRRPA